MEGRTYHRTKSNKWGAEVAWGLGSEFCNECANEYGWVQVDEE